MIQHSGRTYSKRAKAALRVTIESASGLQGPVYSATSQICQDGHRAVGVRVSGRHTSCLGKLESLFRKIKSSFVNFPLGSLDITVCVAQLLSGSERDILQEQLVSEQPLTSRVNAGRTYWRMRHSGRGGWTHKTEVDSER